MKYLQHFVWVSALALVAVTVVADHAAAVKKVYSPKVEHGEFEIEARGRYDFDDGQNALSKQKYAVGYGLTERIFLELYGEIERDQSGNHEFEAVEFEGRYQLFELGERWLDAGLYAAYELALESGNADKFETKVLLQKSFGRTRHTTNLILERQVGSGASSEIETGLAWSSRYQWRREMEPGLEVHSEFGAIDNFAPLDAQTHLVGPVIYGKLGSFKYDIGYLFGATDVTTSGTLKWIIEYEIHF